MSLSNIDRQSGRIDRGRLVEPVFNLSSILIRASMTMKGRLGGAVGGSPARLCVGRRFVFADVSRGEGQPERARRDFPARPARMQAGGINRYSPLYPFMNSRRYSRVIRELK